VRDARLHPAYVRIPYFGGQLILVRVAA
jgi:hypothetical protein